MLSGFLIGIGTPCYQLGAYSVPNYSLVLKNPMPPDMKLSETMKKNHAGLQEADLRNVYVVVCMHSLKARTRGITASEVKDVLQRRGYIAGNVADSLKKLETRQLIVSVQEKQARYYLPKELSRASDATSSSLAGRFSEDELAKLSALVYKAIGRAPVVFDDICKTVQKNEIGALTPEEVRVIIGALIADGAVMEMVTNMGTAYRSVSSDFYSYCPSYDYVPGHQGMHVSATPCCKCPHLYVCGPGSAISPEQCIYINQWLNGVD